MSVFTPRRTRTGDGITPPWWAGSRDGSGGVGRLNEWPLCHPIGAPRASNADPGIAPLRVPPEYVDDDIDAAGGIEDGDRTGRTQRGDGHVSPDVSGYFVEIRDQG